MLNRFQELSITAVVSIGLFSVCFMPISYNGVYYDQPANYISHPTISFISSAQTVFKAVLKWLTMLEDQFKMHLCSNIKFFAKRASKIIVPPQERLLFFSIGTFLTNYDVVTENFNTSQYTPLYENEQNECRKSQWRLLSQFFKSKNKEKSTYLHLDLSSIISSCNKFIFYK